MLKQGVALLVSLGLLAHPVQSLGLEFLNFNLHSVVVGLALLLKLALSEAETLLTLAEPEEQVGEYGHREESLLGPLAVLVHSVSDKGEVYLLLGKEIVFLIVTVRVDHRHQHTHEFLFPYSSQSA